MQTRLSEVGNGNTARARLRVAAYRAQRASPESLSSRLSINRCRIEHPLDEPSEYFNRRADQAMSDQKKPSAKRFQFTGLSDRGRVRAKNEDSIEIDADHKLIVLADGMGGYQAGEVASRLAVKSVRHYVNQNIGDIKPQCKDPKTGLTAYSRLLSEAIHSANQRILKTATTRAEYKGMGTTIVSAIFFGNSLSIAHVGDSRAYRIREKRLERLTLDHSLHQELISRGVFTPEETAKLGNRNVVTRALGMDRDVKIDVVEDVVKPGDVYMLSSDGLHDLVGDEVIGRILTQWEASLNRAAQELIKAANAKGGRDNISVILARARDTQVQSRSTEDNWFKRIFRHFPSLNSAR
ncbi:MAG: Stp1/IreP family PP2C-type Ser/Thr phosphatase [Pseudomonadota bacterium]|nr:Stp1/IreP family PP2C-type Ser/Thr phosphatase [Pseudomonadota bacterium]